MGRKAKEAPRSLSKSLREYQRGVAGGFLFSLPLLFTMEVWWFGFIIPPLRVLAALLFTFLLLLGYNRYAGLRHDANWIEVIIDSIEELGLGLVLAAFFLWLIGQITGEMSASEIIGKVCIEAMIVAIGVSVGTAQLGGNSADEKDSGAGRNPQVSRSRKQAAEGNIQLGGQMVIAFCGAVIVGGNVAPTEEILMIATEISSRKLLGLA